jgi:penicillin-binding protein 2
VFRSALFALVFSSLAFAAGEKNGEYTLDVPLTKPKFIPRSGKIVLQVPAKRGYIVDRHGKVIVENKIKWALGIRFPKSISPIAAVEYAKLQTGLANKILNEKFTFDETRLKLHIKNRSQLAFNLSRVGSSMSVLLSEAEKQKLSAKYIPQLSEDEKAKHLGLYVTAVNVRSYPMGDFAANIVGYAGRNGALSVSTPPFYNGNKALIPGLDFRFEEPAGREGIEAYFDKQLKGRPGLTETFVNSDQSIEYDRLIKYPKNGKDVILSIDSEWQRFAEAQIKGKRAAFVVLDIETGEVMVLATSPRISPDVFEKITQLQLDELQREEPLPPLDKMTREEVEKERARRIAAKLPGYDFQFGDFPLANRGTMKAYPPGSTFKVVTALAALQKDRDLQRAGQPGNFNIDWNNLTISEVNEKTTITCDSKYLVGNRDYYNCNRTAFEGPLNIWEALTRSCNTWFYPKGIETGATAIIAMAEKMGVGQSTGIVGISELPGKLPATTEIKDGVEVPRKIGPGLTASLSIGQWDIAATPIQVANMMRIFALRGTTSSLSIVKKIQAASKTQNFDLPADAQDEDDPSAEDWDKDETLPFPTPIPSSIPSILFDLVGNGLRQVVANPLGTGAGARHELFHVAGKTGTAQWGLHNQEVAWFTGFIPFDVPKYAFAVMIEGRPGEINMGGMVAAPMVGTFFKKFLNDPNGITGKKRFRPLEGDITPHLSERTE